MFNDLTNIQNFADQHPILLILIIIWSLVWKALALWSAARIGHKGWFTAMLIINLFGIPEMIYLYFVARKFKVESSEAV